VLHAILINTIPFIFFQNLAGQTATLTFFVFLPFFGQFHHKAAYRRRTINILLRNVGLLWLLLPCWTQTIFEKSKFREKKYFWIFLDFFFMYRAIWALYRFLYLYKTVFRKQSDKIYPRKIAVEILGPFLPFFGQFHHKAAYRRQTINIVSRHVGLLWLLVPCWKHTIFEKWKFREKKEVFFRIFFGGNVK